MGEVDDADLLASVPGTRLRPRFCFTGDHSYAVTGAWWALHAEVVRLAAALRAAPAEAVLDCRRRPGAR